MEKIHDISAFLAWLSLSMQATYLGIQGSCILVEQRMASDKASGMLWSGWESIGGSCRKRHLSKDAAELHMHAS